MSSQVIDFKSALTVTEIGHLFRSALAGKKVQFKPVESSDNPLAALDYQPSLSVVAMHEKSVGAWAVQLYLFDGAGSRHGELHAVYDSPLSRAWRGTKHTWSKTASVRRLEEVVAALRQADPSLETN